MRIVGVNGIATNGEGNIDVLLHYLKQRGHETIDVQLPKRHFISAWWGHRVDAEAIIEASQDGDAVVAHSFGGPRVAQAMEGRDFRYVFLIRPAMSKYHRFYRNGVYCWYSNDDLPVRIGSYLPFHVFGKAGVDGFVDHMVSNIESTGGHNNDFEGRLHQTVDFIHGVCA